jgi:hypothetical protein
MDRPKSTNKDINAYIDYLEGKLKKFTESPYCDPYITLKMVVDSGNKKIRGLEIDFESENAEVTMNAIEKFATKQKTWAEQLEFFKGKMSPMERKDVEAKMEEDAGTAERMALLEQKK